MNRGEYFMFKKFIYAFMLISINISVAMAENSPASSPLLLSSEQMDQVTAGLDAAVIVNATGSSPFFTFTGSEAVATAAVSDGNDPKLGGYVEIAGGGALAVAAGDGASTSTSVSPTTSSDGLPGSMTFQAGGQAHGDLVEINASAVLTMGSVFVNPL
jgi:hypothetical protein